MKITQYSYNKFLPEIYDRLQEMADKYLDTFNEHQAFNYLVAEIFETTHEDKFAHTDGPNDGGIDFYIKDAPIYTISQCKTPDLDNFFYSNTPITFNDEIIDKTSSAIDMLLDTSGSYEVKIQIKRLRGDFQRDKKADPESTKLIVIIAVLGELTPQAKAKFDAKKALFEKDNVYLKLVDWKTIYTKLHELDYPEDIDIGFEISYNNKLKDVLAHDDYCYLLGNAYDLYNAFNDHGWSLFDWNVRLQMHNSPVNKRIISTLSKAKGRKTFHHYNNGLLITCKKYTHREKQNIIKVEGAQIINGCQTVRSICEAYDGLNPTDQSHFRDTTKVQIKIIKTTDPDFISELVITTNDQNPMNPRNLKSNKAEQRDLQNNFRTLPKRWFYQRKDGEFESYKRSTTRIPGFRKSDFQITQNKYRIIDNQDLAKLWYSFIGYSSHSLRGGVKFFEDESDNAYTKVFKTVPTPTFWSAFRSANFSPNEDYYGPGAPSVYQYLLAHGIAKYIDAKRISYNKNRANAIKRGIIGGVLDGDLESGVSTNQRETIDKYLVSDIEYNINIILSNTREILIELYSFIFANKYAEVDAAFSKNIITNSNEKVFYSKGCDISAYPDTVKSANFIIPSTYEFIKDCMKQYYFEYESELKAAPRLKAYFWQRDTIAKIKLKVIQRNQSIRDYDQPWKLPGKTFIDSLPSI